jgi:hypothetical protein
MIPSVADKAANLMVMRTTPEQIDYNLADLRAVRAWLEHRTPDSDAALVVYRDRTAPADELACVHVVGPGGASDHADIKRDAIRALLALGYRLVEPGWQRLAVAEIRARWVRPAPGSRP